MTCWGEDASREDKNRLNKNMKKAGRGDGEKSTDTVYHQLVTNKLRTVLADEMWPLRPELHNRHRDRSIT